MQKPSNTALIWRPLNCSREKREQVPHAPPTIHSRVGLETPTAGCKSCLSLSLKRSHGLSRRPQAAGGESQTLRPLATDHGLWSHIRGRTASEEKGQRTGLQLRPYIPPQGPCDESLMSMKKEKSFSFLTGRRTNERPGCCQQDTFRTRCCVFGLLRFLLSALF